MAEVAWSDKRIACAKTHCAFDGAIHAHDTRVVDEMVEPVAVYHAEDVPVDVLRRMSRQTRKGLSLAVMAKLRRRLRTSEMQELFPWAVRRSESDAQEAISV